MSIADRELPALLASLEPVRNEGVYVYAVAPAGAKSDTTKAIATFREPEGMTLIMEEREAQATQMPVLFRAAWITLKVHSALDAVGLSAAVASALTRAGISCNIVAAAHHDHLFVPYERGAEALQVLRELQSAHSS